MSSYTLLSVFWTEMVSRASGHVAPRFLLQPLMACAFAICDGNRDARLNRTPYLAAIITIPAARRERFLEGLLAVSRVFIVAVAVDAIYQYIVLTAFRPLQAVIVGLLLAFIPYLLVRGPASRISRWLLLRRQRKVSPSAHR